jgi:uncharacterized protein YkwD
MKRLIITLLLISTILTSYSQTPLDYKVFEKINEYRVENGVRELKWDDKTYMAAKHHTDYMVKNKILSHREDNETPSFITRLLLYLQHDFTTGGENVLRVSVNDTENSIDIIATIIVNAWKTSKGHNRMMLSKVNTTGSVSCGNGFKNGGKLNMVYSTFLVWSIW